MKQQPNITTRQSKRQILARLYSPIEVAEQMGVHRATVYTWIRKGQLEAVVIGGRLVRITDKAIAKFTGAK